MRIASLLVFAFLASMAGAFADDKLLQVFSGGSLIVVEHEGSPQALRLTEKTEIFLNGVKATVEQLQPGIYVKVKTADTQTAARIDAGGVMNSKQAAPPEPKMRSVIIR